MRFWWPGGVLQKRMLPKIKKKMSGKQWKMTQFYILCDLLVDYVGASNTTGPILFRVWHLSSKTWPPASFPHWRWLMITPHCFPSVWSKVLFLNLLFGAFVYCSLFKLRKENRCENCQILGRIFFLVNARLLVYQSCHIRVM